MTKTLTITLAGSGAHCLEEGVDSEIIRTQEALLEWVRKRSADYLKSEKLTTENAENAK